MGQHLSSRAALTCTLVLALLVATPVSAAPGAAETIRVAVDTSGLSEADGQRIREFVQDQLIDDIEADGFTVTDQNVPTTLRVRIEYLDQEDLEYAIHYDIQRDDELLTDVPWIACVTCVDAALLRKIQEGLPPALERIRELTPSEAEPVAEPPSADEPAPTMPAAIGGLGIAGAVVAGVGLGVMIGGGVEYGRGIEFEDAPDRTRTRIDHQLPGGVLLGVGGAALIVGAVLLGVDLGKRAKQRKAARNTSGLVVPLLAPGTVGVGFVRNF